MKKATLTPYFATGLFALAVFSSGCAARTGPIRGDADVRQGDSTSVTGSGQVNTESQTERNKKQSSGAATGSGSGSVTGSGSGSATGSGSVTGSEGSR
jgi:hypothetical protein